MTTVLSLNDYAKGDFPLAVVYVRHGDCPEHAHDFSELVLVFEGQFLHSINGKEYLTGAGEAFVLTDKDVHSYERSDKIKLANILFDPKRLPLPLDALRQLPGFVTLFELEPAFREAHKFQSKLVLSPEAMAHARNLVERLRQELQDQAPGYQPLAAALFTELLIYLARSPAATMASEYQMALSLGKVVSHIGSHFADPTLRLDQLAKAAGMSKRNFQRAFKKGMGTSPINYLLRARVDKAEVLLRTSELPVAEVALAVGFEDSNYFARQFVRHKGVTPRACRRTASPASAAPRPRPGTARTP